MSAESVKQVISRAVTEPEYRSLLFKSPAQALAGYELTGDEQAALSGLTPESFDALVGNLEARISRVVGGGPAGTTVCGGVTKLCGDTGDLLGS
jgi:hypothetical protein